MPRTPNRDLPRTPIRGRRQAVGEGFKPSPTMPDGEPWPPPDGPNPWPVADCDPGLKPGRRGSGALSRRPCLSGRRAGVRGSGIQDRRLLRQAQDRLLRQAQGRLWTPARPASDRNDVVGTAKKRIAAARRGRERRSGRTPPALPGKARLRWVASRNVPERGRRKKEGRREAALQHVLGLRTPLGLPIYGSCRPRRQRRQRSWR